MNIQWAWCDACGRLLVRNYHTGEWVHSSEHAECNNPIPIPLRTATGRDRDMEVEVSE